MNNNRRPLSKKTRKAMDKEIKKGQEKLSEQEDLPRTDSLTTEEALKKYPKKMQKREKALIDSVKKNMAIKKKKAKGGHEPHKTPHDDEDRDAIPAHVVPENAKQKKTIAMQNKVKGEILNAKLQKKKK